MYFGNSGCLAVDTPRLAMQLSHSKSGSLWNFEITRDAAPICGNLVAHYRNCCVILEELRPPFEFAFGFLNIQSAHFRHQHDKFRYSECFGDTRFTVFSTMIWSYDTYESPASHYFLRYQHIKHIIHTYEFTFLTKLKTVDRRRCS